MVPPTVSGRPKPAHALSYRLECFSELFAPECNKLILGGKTGLRRGWRAEHIESVILDAFEVKLAEAYVTVIYA